MKIKPVSEIMLMLLLIGMLALTSNIQRVKAEPAVLVFCICWDGYEFEVVVLESNTTVFDFDFRQGDKEIRFTVSGPSGTTGFCNVTIPKALLIGEPWLILIDGIPATFIVMENATHAMLYFAYVHSTHNVQIIGTWVIGEPPPPAGITAAVDIAPDTLNLKSKGEWITCYIELPKDYNVSDIDIYSIRLNDTFPVSLLPKPPVPVPTEIGDYDNDTIPDLMIKFNRTALTSHIYHTLGITYGDVTLKITGNLTDGTTFEGKDTVKVIFGGDADLNGLIEMPDFYVWRENFGKTPEQCPPHMHPDFDNNEVVELLDFYIWRENFGATTPQQP